MKEAGLYDIVVQILVSIAAVLVFFCPLLLWAVFAKFFTLHWGWTVAMIVVQVGWILAILRRGFHPM